ncbi:MAG TPA: uroporphyrinogen-III synthase [Vicinamibacterales bacterium]|nr:uroporphyrinogen-III synthase [Vicinamibacterales bacterium]
MSHPKFDGLSVLMLESRRARELASIVESYGGRPLVAPSMREIPLESNTDALAFADAVIRQEFDLIVLLTGVGTRTLLELVDTVRAQRDTFIAALGRIPIAARGPKPTAVLREIGLTPWLQAPEPNTWRELVTALDQRAEEMPLRARRVAVQEYGAPNPELLQALEERGALVRRVPIYQWALPEDLEPLRQACRALAEGSVDVVLLTTATQLHHLLEVAGQLGVADGVRAGLERAVVASIGPTTSDALRQEGVPIDLEASHPKMGFLVREAADRAATLLAAKRAT